MDPVRSRELEYHDRLYSGFAQEHFSRPAVRALRQHLVRHILRAIPTGRVLSLGCGIGDTELLLARQVREVVGVDASAAGIRQARADAARMEVANASFLEGTLEELPLEPGDFDAAIAIFFLHHLPEDELARLPVQVMRLLRPGGVFYSLDPSRLRLSGRVGRLLVPRLMRRYQTPDERELDAAETASRFAGFETRWGYYDFVSTPLAGLLPGWRLGYRLARLADDLLVRTPGVRRLGSNFEIIARKPR